MTRLILALLLLAANSAFAVLRPPFPIRPTPPFQSGTVIVIGDTRPAK